MRDDPTDRDVRERFLQRLQFFSRDGVRVTANEVYEFKAALVVSVAHRAQHRQGRGDARASREEDDRLARGGQNEVALCRTELDDCADRELVVNPRRDAAAFNATDRQRELLGCGAAADGPGAGEPTPIDLQADAHMLPRLKTRPLAIGAQGQRFYAGAGFVDGHYLRTTLLNGPRGVELL